LNGKSFIFNTDMSKSSPQVCKSNMGMDFQAEPLKQDCLMVCGAADTAFADRDARACGQHDIDQGDLLEIGEDLARFVAEAGALAPLVQRFPKHKGKKANQDVGLHAVFFLAPDGPHDQVALVEWKRFFGFRELDIGAPELYANGYAMSM
jgi:hypothetical protein